MRNSVMEASPRTDDSYRESKSIDERWRFMNPPDIRGEYAGHKGRRLRQSTLNQKKAAKSAHAEGSARGNEHANWALVPENAETQHHSSQDVAADAFLLQVD